MKCIFPLLAAVALASIGCMRPFDAPEFVEIQHHETGYLIPLEGKSVDGQKKFNSEDALDKNRVAIKRIQIPHRWVQTGRIWLGFMGRTNGDYIDTVRLVVVNRSPVTREWTADENSGTTSVNQAIWLESRDSIGFSLGFNCTAEIEEENSTTFLYKYPTTTVDTTVTDVDKSTTGLTATMDTEIRARVQMLANQVASLYNLDDLRARKQEILNVVRNGVVESKDKQGNIVQEKLLGTLEHFSNRGITITNLGQFGGFEYEESEIQNAINETFVAQQAKVKTEAAFNAQAKVNEKIELEADALANKARKIAQGEADAIRFVASAAEEAGKNPLFLKLKELEVESQRIAKWDGVRSKTVLGSSPDILMTIDK